MGNSDVVNCTETPNEGRGVHITYSRNLKCLRDLAAVVVELHLALRLLEPSPLSCNRRAVLHGTERAELHLRTPREKVISPLSIWLRP